MRESKSKSAWQKTKTQGLIRYTPKGTYYGYFKAGGKLFRKSLGTDVYEVARLHVGDEIAEKRAQAEEAAKCASGNLTFADALREYRTGWKPIHNSNRPLRTIA